MELLKLLSASEIVAQIISFLILLVLLRILVWKRVLSLLDKRREKIASELKAAQDARKEIETLKANYEAQLKSIDQFTKVKIKEAISEGKKITEEMKKKAEKETGLLLENANEKIAQELLKAKEELKNHIIDLTISATENIIEKKLTPEDDRRLVEDFLESMNKPK